MRIGESMLAEWDQEMATTRRVLERVPTDKGDWKPHAKSFSLAHLAQLVSWIPGWVVTTIEKPDLNLAGGAGYSNESTAKLLELFDENVKRGREALAGVSDDALAQDWSLKMGDRVLMTQPRKVVVRQHVSHLVHHRAQLGVYLRLLDVPVPSMYGPTADERW
jgi:uncharacterized damage-inducible protein DinB